MSSSGTVSARFISAALPQLSAERLRLSVQLLNELCGEAQPGRIHKRVGAPIRQSLTALCCGKAAGNLKLAEQK